MLTSISLNLIFIWLWKQLGWPGAHAGLALATSISAYVNAALLFIILKRSQVLMQIANWFKITSTILISALGMVFAIKYLLPATAYWVNLEIVGRFTHLIGFILLGTLVYITLLYILGLRPKHFKLPRATVA